MKRVVVTGGTKGIGLETARLFQIVGWTVYVVGRSFQGFELRGVDRIEEVEFDLSQVERIPELVKSIGCVDALINNAGVMFSLPYDEYPRDKVETILRLNLEAPVALMRDFGAMMAEQSYGRIVNLSSLAAHTGHADIWYGVTKAGILNATKSFAKLLGPSGVTVNAVAPGPTQTGMMEVIPKARKEMILKSVYSGRFALASEVARTILWLSTECPEYINGTCIDINNGACPR